MAYLAIQRFNSFAVIRKGAVVNGESTILFRRVLPSIARVVRNIDPFRRHALHCTPV